MEEFVEQFSYRATEHLQACYGPKLREIQISRIILQQAVQASVDSDYPVNRVTILPVHGGEVTVLINEGIRIDIPLEKRKEAVNG